MFKLQNFHVKELFFMMLLSHKCENFKVINWPNKWMFTAVSSSFGWSYY